MALVAAAVALVAAAIADVADAVALVAAADAEVVALAASTIYDHFAASVFEERGCAPELVCATVQI